MCRSLHSFLGVVRPARPNLVHHPHCILLLLCLLAPVSFADDAAHLQDIIHAYADNPGDTLILHVRVAPGVIFHPETVALHKNIALDAIDVSKFSHDINFGAKPKYKGVTLCVANLNELSASQCKDWSSYWSQPAWDPASNRPCQRGICSVVLLVSSGAIREPHCSALPQVHLKKISSVKSGCRNHGTNGSSCRSPVFDIATNRSTFGNADPRLELILNDQLDLHSRILGVGSNQRIYRPFPSNISDMKHFFVGQEHIMSELKSILDEREFDVASHSSKVLVLVFAGVSGTGKTMLAELIANVIHGQSVDELKADGKFFQQDMGGWQNPEDSDALFGVKQGIVGDAKLYDLIKRNPDIVVCLDEFSRAHESNRNAFFSAFDTHVQDKKTGLQVKTNRVTFILTTNTGQDALLETSGVLDDPPRWNSRHNRSLPEVETVIQSGLREFRRDDPIFKDSAFRARIREFFMFLPYSFEMRLEILNMTIARETLTWGGCVPLSENGCHCYGCKPVSYNCECESNWKMRSSSKVVFSHRAKIQLLTKMSKEATEQKEYPNTRKLKSEVHKHKLIVKHYMETCDLLEGDGLIIDYDFDRDRKIKVWCGNVVPLATDRQAKKEACLNQRSNTANPPLQHISSSEDLSSSFAPSASQGHKNKNGAAAHLAVERDFQHENDMDREIQLRISKAVSDITAEHEAKLKAAEEAARDRENAQAIAHAKELQVAQEKEKQVRAELTKTQALLAIWQRRFAIVAAALAAAVSVIVVLLFKILASPILLSVAVVFLVLGVALLFYFFPDLALVMLQFLKWMWNNPTWGIVIIVTLFIIYRFRSKLFKKIFGETQIEKLLAQHQDDLNKISKLEEDLNSLQCELQNLRKSHSEMLPTRLKASSIETVQSPPELTPVVPASVQETGAAVAEQKMFSDSPPSRPGQTLPAHTPIRNISSP